MNYDSPVGMVNYRLSSKSKKRDFDQTSATGDKHYTGIFFSSFLIEQDQFCGWYHWKNNDSRGMWHIVHVEVYFANVLTKDNWQKLISVKYIWNSYCTANPWPPRRSNPVEARIFFRLLPSNCLNWKFYCDDHFSLSEADKLTLMLSFWSLICVFHNSFAKSLLTAVRLETQRGPNWSRGTLLNFTHNGPRNTFR